MPLLPGGTENNAIETVEPQSALFLGTLAELNGERFMGQRLLNLAFAEPYFEHLRSEARHNLFPGVSAVKSGAFDVSNIMGRLSCPGKRPDVQLTCARVRLITGNPSDIAVWEKEIDKFRAIDPGLLPPTAAALDRAWRLGDAHKLEELRANTPTAILLAAVAPKVRSPLTVQRGLSRAIEAGLQCEAYAASLELGSTGLKEIPKSKDLCVASQWLVH